MKLINSKKAMNLASVVIMLLIIAIVAFVIAKYAKNADANLGTVTSCENNPAGLDRVCDVNPPSGYNPDPLYEGKAAIKAGCSKGESCYYKFG